MCGRFTLTTPDFDTLARALGVDPDPELAARYRPRWNLPPMDPHWVVRARPAVPGPGVTRELLPAGWGLLPYWEKRPETAARRINARAETVRDKPAFRDAFRRRRCVVPADGFFEWTGPPRAKRPIWFHPPAGELLLFAGLYEKWLDPAAQSWRRTFTIITTAANDVVAPHHDRMPAILAPEDVDTWLQVPELESPAGDGEDALLLLRPAPNALLVPTLVSTRVNKVAHDDPACLEAAEDGAAVGETLSLFGPGRSP